ncbi:MAG: hybrid sensor histidine kinase/response regulator [Pseudomonadota bacterium]
MSDRSLTVLLVEDDPEDAHLVKRGLAKAEGMSCEVHHAASLREALERIAQGGIDVALVDLSLPDSSGLGSFKEIHRLAPEVPVIILSGLSDRETAVQVVQMGAQDFIVKGSVRPEFLIRSIQYAIERKKVQEMKDRFVSTVSHELRTPLTNMKGIVSNLFTGVAGELNPKMKDYLSRVGANIDRLMQIVNDLLDMSKLAARKIVLKRAWTEAAPFFTDITELFESQAALRGVGLKLEVPAAPVKLYFDEGRMRQVLLNLIGNALKFTPPGGTVTIALTVSPQEGVFSVSDTGEGISPEHLEKIFDPFYQVEHEAGGGGKGTGLGLAITKEIVEMHGGKVKVESAVGQGTRFQVILPIPDNQGETTAADM